MEKEQKEVGERSTEDDHTTSVSISKDVAGARGGAILSPERAARSKRLSKQQEIVDDVESLIELSTSVTGLRHKSIGSQLHRPSLSRTDALCGDDDTRLSIRAARGGQRLSGENLSATGTPGRTNVPIYSSKGAGSVATTSSSLSRDSSAELYTDDLGTDLNKFLDKTLHKSPKDRQQLLEIEAKLREFVEDPKKQVYEFGPMSSYNRMLVHRVAAIFGLMHNVNQEGNAVFVNKDANTTRIPDFQFRDIIQHEEYTEPKERLKRTLHKQYGQHHAFSNEEFPGYLAPTQSKFFVPGLDPRQTRSFDDRLPEGCAYHYPFHQRARILKQDSCSSGDPCMESPISGYSSDWSSSPAHALHPVGHFASAPARPWSSADSGSFEVVNYPVTSSAAFQHPALVATTPPARPPSLPPGRAALFATQQKAGSFGGLPTSLHQQQHHGPPRRSNTDTSEVPAGSSTLMRQPCIMESMYHEHQLSQPCTPPLAAATPSHPLTVSAAHLQQPLPNQGQPSPPVYYVVDQGTAAAIAAGSSQPTAVIFYPSAASPQACGVAAQAPYLPNQAQPVAESTQQPNHRFYIAAPQGSACVAETHGVGDQHQSQQLASNFGLLSISSGPEDTPSTVSSGAADLPATHVLPQEAFVSAFHHSQQQQMLQSPPQNMMGQSQHPTQTIMVPVSEGMGACSRQQPLFISAVSPNSAQPCQQPVAMTYPGPGQVPGYAIPPGAPYAYASYGAGATPMYGTTAAASGNFAYTPGQPSVMPLWNTFSPQEQIESEESGDVTSQYFVTSSSDGDSRVTAAEAERDFQPSREE